MGRPGRTLSSHCASSTPVMPGSASCSRARPTARCGAGCGWSRGWPPTCPLWSSTARGSVEGSRTRWRERSRPSRPARARAGGGRRRCAADRARARGEIRVRGDDEWGTIVSLSLPVPENQDRRRPGADRRRAHGDRWARHAPAEAARSRRAPPGRSAASAALARGRPRGTLRRVCPANAEAGAECSRLQALAAVRGYLRTSTDRVTLLAPAWMRQ